MKSMKTLLISVIVLSLLAVSAITLSQTPPSTPPSNDLVWVKGYVFYNDVNNDEVGAPHLHVYAMYTNGTVPSYEGASTISADDGSYQLLVPRPDNNLVKICAVDAIANLTYCTASVNVSSASALVPAEINVTIPRLNLSFLATISNGSQILIVIGNGTKWGPLHWGAKSADNAAATAIGGAFGVTEEAALDGNLLGWNSTAHKAYWKSSAMSLLSQKRVIITVGGLGVNAVTWTYAYDSHLAYIDIRPDGLPALVLDNGAAQIVYNSTTRSFVYINATGAYNVTQVPSLNVTSDKYGKVGFGLVFIDRDPAINKTIVVVEGLTGYGTRAAGVWLANAVATGTLPSDKAIVVIAWNDLNNDKGVQANEVHIITSY